MHTLGRSYSPHLQDSPCTKPDLRARSAVTPSHHRQCIVRAIRRPYLRTSRISASVCIASLNMSSSSFFADWVQAEVWMVSAIGDEGRFQQKQLENVLRRYISTYNLLVPPSLLLKYPLVHVQSSAFAPCQLSTSAAGPANPPIPSLQRRIVSTS